MANGDRIAELRRFIDRLRRDESSSSDFSQPSLPSDMEDGKEDIPLLEQLIEGAKEIPSGLYSTLLDAPAGLLTALTPFADLPIEQRLREAAARGLRDRDPRMEGKFIPTLGSALGSIGAYTGVGTLSAYLAPAAAIAGGPLAGAAYGALALAALGGISEQGRRMARREQKTGRDIPAWKETPAHLLGGVIGLSELVPFKLARTGLAGRAIPEDVLNYLMQKGVLRKAIAQGTEEAFQESLALGLQATVGRGLYDPDAFEDLGKAMVEDFKIGGAAGVISSLAGSAYVGGRRRWDRHQRAQDFGVNMQLTKALETKGLDELDPKTVQREVREDLQAENISENKINEIIQLLHNQYPLPVSVQERLLDGSYADKQMLSNHRTLMQEYYQRLETIIDSSPDPDLAKAKPIIKKHMDRRMENLNNIVNQMESEGMDHGGLTRSKQYEEVKRKAFDESTGEDVLDHAYSRDQAKRRGREVPTFRDKIRQVIGGKYGILGLFRDAEVLGVHGGLGSRDIDTTIDEPGRSILGPDTRADETLASSENASYSPVEIARVFAENYSSFLAETSLGAGSVNFLNDLEKIENDLKEAHDRSVKSYSLVSEDGADPIDKATRRRNTDLLMAATADSTEKARALSRDTASASTDFIVRHLGEALQNARRDAGFRQRASRRLGINESDLVVWLEGLTARMQKNQQELEQTDREFNQGLAKLVIGIRRKYEEDIKQLDTGDEQGVREFEQRMNDEIAETEAQFRQNRRRIKSDISATDLSRMTSLFLGTDTQAPAQARDSINIWHGTGDNAVLSNLASRSFTYQGREYVSVEHAYQTLKSGSFDPETYNKDWKEGVKIQGKGVDKKGSLALMRDLMLESFRQNPQAIQALANTGNATLTHNEDTGIWQKEFPRILTDIRSQLARIFPDIRSQLVSPTKTQPGILPMNFRDGDGGLSMQPQFKGASTFDLIKSGNRTGTSRTSINKNYKVGDVIEVKGRGKEKILVEIQAHDDGSVWKKVSDIPAQEWMASEGWDQNAYDKLAKGNYFQVRYKYLSSPQVTTPTYKMFSGDALGSDKTWESIGREYGLEDVTHHTEKTLTPEQSKEARPYLIEANKKVGRNYPSTNQNTNQLLERDYLQARDADAVFAVGTIVTPSERGTNRWAIKGGTQWAVQVAIDMGKPVYIFNQKGKDPKTGKIVGDNKWYTTTDGMDLKIIDTPALTPNFAAIGTRSLTAEGKKAIRDVFEKSMPKDAPTTPTKATPKKSVIDALFGARALNDIFNWNSYRILAPSTSKYNSEAGEQVDNLLERIETQRKKDPSKVVDISEQDIINLLSSKNYFLSGGGPLKLSDQMVKDLYGDQVGLDSLPFRKLLADMTGAKRWVDATPIQKLLMYSRLLQLPGRSKDDDAYLPDFYDDPTEGAEFDATTDAVLQAIVRPIRGQALGSIVTEEEIETIVEREIGGANVVPQRIKISLARLVESGLVQATDKGYRYNPDVDKRAFGDLLEKAKERWGEQVDPDEVRKILSADEHKADIKKMQEEYTAATGQSLTRQEFIKRVGSFIGSEAGLEEASRLGLMADFRSGGTSAGSMFTDDGIATDILTKMVVKGAIPVTVTPTAGQFQKEYIERSRQTHEIYKNSIDRILREFGTDQTVRVKYLDEIDGMFNNVGEVLVRGEGTASQGLSLMKQGLVTQMAVDLSVLDPDATTQEDNIDDLIDMTVKASTIEGLMRDHYTDSQFKVLVDFVQNNVVSKDVNTEAFNNNVTWEQANALGMSNTKGMNPLDITFGAIGDVFVALHNGTLRKKDIPKSVGTIHGITRRLLGGIIRSVQQSELQQVISIYNQAVGGVLSQNAEIRRQDLKDRNLITDEGVPLNLTRFASPAEVAELRTAQSLVNKLVDPAQVSEQQDKVDKITERIVSRGRQIKDSSFTAVSEEDEIKDEAMITKMAGDVGSYGIPVMGARQTLDEDTYVRARHQALSMINDGTKPYAMPREYRSFFDSQYRVSKDVADKVAPKYKKGDPLRELIMPGGPLSEKIAADSFEEMVGVFRELAPEYQINYNEFRMSHIDSGEPVVALEQSLAAHQNRQVIDAQQSALFALRMADISGNYLQSLMLHGPLSYTGVDSIEGMFEYSPVDAPSNLKTKYNIDYIPGLIEIMDLIGTRTDETAATLYGLAKALQHDLKKVREFSGKGGLSPEAARLEAMHKRRYGADKDVIPKAAEELSGGKIKTEADLFAYIIEIETNDTNAHIVEFWDYYEAFNKHMLRNVAGRAGLLGTERLEALIERPYIPRYGVAQDPGAASPIENIRTRGPDVLERELGQSDQPFSNELIKNMQGNLTRMLRDSMYNVATARVVGGMVELGQAYEVDMSSLLASISPDVVSFKIEGVTKHYKLSDKGLALAVMSLGVNPQREWTKLFGGLNPRVQEGLVKAITGAPSIVRNVVTKSLDFMARNIFRDSTIARMIAGPKIAGMGFYLDVLEKALSGKAVIEAAEKLQLSFGVDFFNTPNGRGDEVQRKRTQKELRTKKFDWKKPWTAMGVTWQALGTISQATESATRVALYEAVLAETGDRGHAIRTSIELLNYGRRGLNPVSAMVMSTMPFISGRIAGLDVGWRALFSKRDMDRPGMLQYGYTAKEWEALPWYEKERVGMFGEGLFLAMATGLYYFMMQDNEDWKALNEETAANNWMIPVGGGFLHVPIPHEFGFLFKLIPEQIMKAMLEKEYTASEAASQIRRAGLNMVTTGGPTLIMPLVNVQRNYDAYLKEPIVSAFMEDLAPEQQQRESTSPVARGMAATVRSIPLLRDLPVVDNFQSALMVEYFMNQYLTGIAMDTRFVVDKIAREALGMPTIGTREDYDLERIFGVPLRQFVESGELNIPAELGRLPIGGDIFTDPRLYRGYIQELYELVDDYNRVKKQIDAAVTYQDALEIRQENERLVSRGSKLLAMRRRLTKLRERRAKVQKRQGEGQYDSPEGQIVLRKEELRQIEETQRIAKMVPELSAYIKAGGG